MPATQFNYDLKYGTKLLWGEDCLGLIPSYAPGDIDIASARRLLINRMICLLECYKSEFLQREMTQDEKYFIFMQSSKVILACAEAFLIRTGNYNCRYKRRLEIIKGMRTDRDREHFIQMLQTATDFKLKPSVKAYTENGNIHYWNQTLKIFVPFICQILDQSSLRQRNIREFINSRTPAVSLEKIWDEYIVTGKTSEHMTRVEELEFYLILLKYTEGVK